MTVIKRYRGEGGKNSENFYKMLKGNIAKKINMVTKMEGNSPMGGEGRVGGMVREKEGKGERINFKRGKRQC